MEVFVARQPILDRQRNLFGYELLYRSDAAHTQFDGTEAASATQQVISSSILSLGLDNLLGGKKAFINFDERLLRERVHLHLPSQDTVIEILETVEPTSDLIALCRGIRDEGYTIALDDFVSSPQFEPLTRLAQLIKVDIQLTGKPEQERLLRTYQPRGIAMLAEKVETHEEFEWTRAAGYDYFQGYFFARPSVIRSHQVPANKLHCLRLLTEVQKPELDFKRLEALIRLDVALAYKLMRYVNSALFSHRTEIKSIENAMTVLGTDNLRHWVALATLPMLATDKPGELATLSLVRARFCESLIGLAGLRLRERGVPDGNVLASGRAARSASSGSAGFGERRIGHHAGAAGHRTRQQHVSPDLQAYAAIRTGRLGRSGGALPRVRFHRSGRGSSLRRSGGLGAANAAHCMRLK